MNDLKHRDTKKVAENNTASRKWSQDLKNHASVCLAFGKGWK